MLVNVDTVFFLCYDSSQLQHEDHGDKTAAGASEIKEKGMPHLGLTFLLVAI